MSREIDYKELYEREHEKCLRYVEQISELEASRDMLQFKLDRICKNPVWIKTTGIRRLVLRIGHFLKRLRGIGGIRGFCSKLKRKLVQKNVRSDHGTKSFPNRDRRIMEEETQFECSPLISILVPLYNTRQNFLEQMIHSVKEQTYSNWQLCLADGSERGYEYIKAYIDGLGDDRIAYKKLESNRGISGNTNECLSLAKGDYIALFDHDDILHPSVLYEYVRVINEQQADYIYCDESTFSGDSIDNMITLHFKPDYAPDTLRANNYICHFSCFKRSLLEGEELFRSRYDGSQDHDMILRLTDKAEKIVHVPKMLYYWRSHAGSVAGDINAKSYAIDAAKGAVADSLQKHGFKNFKITSTRAFETIFKISYEILGEPKVSIIVPNNNHKGDLERLITSIFEKTTYGNYEIIVVENNSTDGELFKYYDIIREKGVKIITRDGEFNYSGVNNQGVEAAEGEYIILLNNDTSVITPSWIEELLMYCQREDVGAVGCKLLYPDRTIQHAGVILGLGAHRTAGHIHYKESYENLGYMGRLCYAQNMSAVTGACLMVKKRDYISLGGLDEVFRISLNDVDFCLRLRKKGLLNVFTPFAELYHYESASRGIDIEDKAKEERYEEECRIFRERWSDILAKGDPYYNPNFSLDKSDFSLKTREEMEENQHELQGTV